MGAGGYPRFNLLTSNVIGGCLIFLLAGQHKKAHSQAARIDLNDKNATLIRPKVPNRQPIPPEVPPEFTEDYREACEILAESPKASAALSRRCLQFILREKAGVNKGNLKQEIDEVISTGSLTAEIADSLHTLREIGNFAAHPQHHQGTGEIVPVEPGEAEWCLEVIEMLFDFYFVRPADIQKRQRAWEQKRIASRGK